MSPPAFDSNTNLKCQLDDFMNVSAESLKQLFDATLATLTREEAISTAITPTAVFVFSVWTDASLGETILAVAGSGVSARLMTWAAANPTASTFMGPVAAGFALLGATVTVLDEHSSPVDGASIAAFLTAHGLQLAGLKVLKATFTDDATITSG